MPAPIRAVDAEAPGERRDGACALLDRWSIEITARDGDAIAAAAALIPPGTKVPIAFLPGDAFEDRVATARRVRDLGFVPVPHISARRLQSAAELDRYLAALARDAGVDHALIVAGDPVTPLGPYSDALAVIASGLPARHGITRVGITGYPEGHPGIAAEAIWRAKHDKRAMLMRQGLDLAIVTQFGFDAAPMLRWVEEVRAAGIDAPIRLGVPGPANAKRLLGFAARCGVGTSAKVLGRYGVSLSRLLTTTGPERLIDALAAGYDARRHGVVLLHFYPFGGLVATARWVRDFRASRGCPA